MNQSIFAWGWDTRHAMMGIYFVISIRTSVGILIILTASIREYRGIPMIPYKSNFIRSSSRIFISSIETDSTHNAN